MIFVSTRWGIGTSPDSAVYLGVARNLEEGRGMTVPFGADIDAALSQFPPIYSLLIRLVNATGLDIAMSARLIQAVLFGINIILLTTMGRDGAYEIHWGVILGAMLVLFISPFVENHLMAWSEPLFIFSGFTGLFFLSRYLDGGSRVLLIAAALWTSIAALTRYIGVAFILTGGLGILLWASVQGRRRGWQVLIFTLISFIPLGAWMLIGLISGSGSTGRELALHPFGRQHIWQSVETVAGWFYIPASLSGLLKISFIGLVGTILLTLLFVRQLPDPSNSSKNLLAKERDLPVIIRLMLIFIPIYVGLVLLSISFVDANTPLDNRILAPVLAAGLVLISHILSRPTYHAPRLSALRNLAVVGVMAIVALSIADRFELIQENYANGIGFNHTNWRKSQAMREVEKLTDEWIIYANSPEAIWLRTGKSAHKLPKPWNAMNLRENQEFLSELKVLEGRFEQEKGVIIYFDSVSGSSIPSEATLADYLPLIILEVVSDGAIYTVETGG